MSSRAGRVVLIVGSGAREHALARRLATSPSVARVIVTPGNTGTAAVATNIAVPTTSGFSELCAVCTREGVDLVVVGPEAPLVAGIADALRAHGVPVFGPSQAAARLEGSKAFMKRFARAEGIPTSAFEVFHAHEFDDAVAFIRTHPRPLVVKADGLCAGKGVVVAADAEEAVEAARSMLLGGAFGEAGRTIVVEERVVGSEASVHAICDGTRYLLLPAVQDHKRIGEGDTGANTGGMGAYGPTPLVTRELEQRIAEQAIEPVLRGLAAQGTPFTGALFAGLMISAEGELSVLEYNVRFGDPETEVLMELMDGDWGEALAEAASGKLDPTRLRRSARHAIAVVLASAGYPGEPRLGDAIAGIEDAERVAGVSVLHAGTRRDGDRLVTAGGRVLVVTAAGDTLKHARDVAYRGASTLSWKGMQLRADIGARAFASDALFKG